MPTASSSVPLSLVALPCNNAAGLNQRTISNIRVKQTVMRCAVGMQAPNVVLRWARRSGFRPPRSELHLSSRRQFQVDVRPQCTRSRNSDINRLAVHLVTLSIPKVRSARRLDKRAMPVSRKVRHVTQFTPPLSTDSLTRFEGLRAVSRAQAQMHLGRRFIELQTMSKQAAHMCVASATSGPTKKLKVQDGRADATSGRTHLRAQRISTCPQR